MHPTTHKPRLPPWLSYPIGFEHISHALGSVPQSDALELVFFDNPDPHMKAMAFRKTVELGSPHLVVSGRFDRWDITQAPATCLPTISVGAGVCGYSPCIDR